LYNCSVFEAKVEEIPLAKVDRAWTIAMNKRTFIRLFSAMMASPVISPLLARATKDKLSNWAGNLEYGTDRLYSANSLDEVRKYVKKQHKLKVLGTRHCFNNIADSTDNFLSLKPMAAISELCRAPGEEAAIDGGFLLQRWEQQAGPIF